MGIDISAAFGMAPEDAVKFFEQKGYAITWSWTELWQEAQARAFTAAGVTSMEVLNDLRQGLQSALANGKTAQQFADQVTPLLKDKGWWGRDARVDKATGEITGKGLTAARLSLIYQQNLQTAYMAGRYKAMRESVDTHPYWQYIAIMDRRTRPAHAALNGMVFRADDPIWDAIFPPNGFRCRCRVRPLTEAGMTREGLAVADSRPFTTQIQVPVSPRNPAFGTTTVTQVAMPGRPAFTVDAGFNYNPGRVGFQPELDKYTPEVAQQYVQGVLTGPDFKQWYEKAQEAVQAAMKAQPTLDQAALRTQLRPAVVAGQRFPVAVLSDAGKAMMGTSTRVVELSDDTLLKQLINRSGQDVGLADYWQVQPTLQDADVVVRSGDSHYLFHKAGNKTYVAVVKVTAKRHEIFLQSFRISSDADLRKIKAKGDVVKGG